VGFNVIVVKLEFESFHKAQMWTASLTDLLFPCDCRAVWLFYFPKKERCKTGWIWRTMLMFWIPLLTNDDWLGYNTSSAVVLRNVKLWLLNWPQKEMCTCWGDASIWSDFLLAMWMFCTSCRLAMWTCLAERKWAIDCALKNILIDCCALQYWGLTCVDVYRGSGWAVGLWSVSV